MEIAQDLIPATLLLLEAYAVFARYDINLNEIEVKKLLKNLNGLRSLKILIAFSLIYIMLCLYNLIKFNKLLGLIFVGLCQTLILFADPVFLGNYM